MRKTAVFALCFLFVFSLFLLSCSGTFGYQTSYEDAETMKAEFLENRELYEKVALEAFGYGDSIFIFTYEFFRPEGADEDAVGLYVHDNDSGATEALESETVAKLFEACSVNSLAVKKSEEVAVCEFSIGGGRQYFNGIYYVEQNHEVFLNNFSVPLEKDGDGYSYSVENMNYYTEKWADNFYYYVAKTR